MSHTHRFLTYEFLNNVSHSTVQLLICSINKNLICRARIQIRIVKFEDNSVGIIAEVYEVSSILLCHLGDELWDGLVRNRRDATKTVGTTMVLVF